MAKMTQKERILALLKRDARISVEELAARLAVAPSKIEKAIEELESDGTIVGYAAIVGDDQEKSTRAIIEVQIQPERDAGFDNIAERICKFDEVVSAYLVSGRYDLHLEVVGNSLQEVAHFVGASFTLLSRVLPTSQLQTKKKLSLLSRNSSLTFHKTTWRRLHSWNATTQSTARKIS